MQEDFKNKVVLVTGATGGMGKAIAEAFARQGAAVVLSGRDVKKGEDLAEELGAFNANILFIPGDVAIAGDNRKLIREAIKKFGHLDLLSLNAGVLGLGPVTTLPLETWDQTWQTNVSSVFYLCKYALPEMVKHKSGSIVINASIAAFRSFPNHPAYCASKAAVVALARQMAVDYGPQIRVNAICPGPVDTSLLLDSAVAFDPPETAVDAARQATLMQRLGQPADIAELVLFLSSERASWITGTAIRIDGGILNA